MTIAGSYELENTMGSHKVLLLNISKTYSDSVKQTSECHLSKETKTMHIIQMVQEQHAIYFGYAFF